MTFSMTFTAFHDLTFSCHFRKILKPYSCNCFSIYIYTYTFYLKQFNRNKLWNQPKCLRFALFNYSSLLSHVILILSSAVTNLPNKTLIFHDFQGPTITFHDFPGFPRPARTLEMVVKVHCGTVLGNKFAPC